MAGCGAAASAVRSDRICPSVREQAVRTWTALGDALDPGEPTELPETYAQLETLRERLAQHLAASEGSELEVPDEEAEALANAMMDAIDACESTLPAPLRDRAESAAEGLLSERRAEAGREALRTATSVIDEMERAAHPDLASVDQRQAHLRATRAREIAAGYQSDLARGDELAETWSRQGGASEDAALAASREVRDHCPFERTLHVPAAP